MCNKLAALGGSPAHGDPQQQTSGLHNPYAESHVNYLYNLLFCDDTALFRNPAAANADPTVWAKLLAEPPNPSGLRDIANDETNEGRIRALAYNRLRMMGEEVPPKILLGVIVEVPLAEGLDVLAAFSEGSVRYLNQSGKVVVIETDGTPVARLARELIVVSQPVIDQIGPWAEPRLPPPAAGNVRITFLVSDGLYFGEGPYSILQSDGMAGPVLAKAMHLLSAVVDPASAASA